MTDEISAAAATLGRKGGLSTSEAKQAASRENGKRGGRPKKDQATMSQRHTIYRSGYKSQAAYSNDYQDLCRRYDYKAKVDDGKGGSGWMFFESEQDYRTWKNQK